VAVEVEEAVEAAAEDTVVAAEATVVVVVVKVAEVEDMPGTTKGAIANSNHPVTVAVDMVVAKAAMVEVTDLWAVLIASSLNKVSLSYVFVFFWPS